ncbi:MAG: DUF805 domain-containing protein [Gammaproteobacteria bacterium]|nr:DUF805 domain-containing protein [Gammaproteobacteria bacterium]
MNKNDKPSNEIKWYSPSGRIGRLRFCCYTMSFLASCALFFYVLLTDKTTITTTEAFVAVFVLGLAAMYIVFIYPIRRLNDLNRTGYLIFIFCIPFINIAFYLYLLLIPGSSEENKYGEITEQNKAYYWSILALSTCIVATYAYIKYFK